MSKLFLSVLTCFLIITCTIVSAQTRVSYDKSNEMDFGSYKTYKINKLDVKTYPEFEPKKEGLNTLVFEIEKQMNGLGFSQAVTDAPDLLLNIGVVITPVERTRETGLRDAPLYGGQRNYHWEREEVVFYKYAEGAVTLDLVDVEKNELIWQVVSKDALEKKREKNKKKIEKAVKKIFKKFPVQE
jgi:hypothetical protein